MSQTIFDVTTTKGQALTGINANFTEVYNGLFSVYATAAQGAKADTALQDVPALSDVLTHSANGGAVDQTNLGSLSLADGKTIRMSQGSSPMTTDAPAGYVNFIVGSISVQIPYYQ